MPWAHSCPGIVGCGVYVGSVSLGGGDDPGPAAAARGFCGAASSRPLQLEGNSGTRAGCTASDNRVACESWGPADGDTTHSMTVSVSVAASASVDEPMSTVTSTPSNFSSQPVVSQLQYASDMCFTVGTTCKAIRERVCRDGAASKQASKQQISGT